MNDNMNGHEKTDEFEAPALTLENEELPVPGVEPEPEVVMGVEADAMTGEELNDKTGVEKAPSPIGFPTRTFNAGDVIFQEGDAGDEAYLILDGQVKITRQHKKKRMLVNELGKDQIFGEMAIITGDPRSATAEAMIPTELFIITESKLNENLSQHLAIVKSLIDQLIDRMKQLLKQQSTFLSKVEQAMVRDKKLEAIKVQAGKYVQEKSADDMEEELTTLFDMIQQL